jgi:cholesterol oxidase
MRRQCINCGDCMTGCNVGAENTVYMNYLPLAKMSGAQIFTQTAVRHSGSLIAEALS